MSAPVDVLAVMERVARNMDALSLLDQANSLRECHSELAELIDYAESAVEYVAKCADAVDVNHRVAGRPDSLNVARVVEQNLRSALARVRGGAA